MNDFNKKLGDLSGGNLSGKDVALAAVSLLAQIAATLIGIGLKDKVGKAIDYRNSTRK